MKALGLRARLLLLLGLAVLPAVALLLIGRAAEQAATLRELHAQAMNLARLTGQAYAQRIEVARQLLIALSTHPEMRGADAAGGALDFLKGKSSGRSGWRHHKITASSIAI